MKLFLFGPLRIKIAHQTRLLTGSQAALLGLLALNEASDFAVTRTRLAGTLWPEVGEERARRLLSQTLYRLRQQLGSAAGHLIVKPDVVALQDVWVDTAVFRHRLASPKPADWTAALDLYVGDLLEELDGYWLLSARADLRERYLTALSRTTAQLHADGQPDEALLMARRWTLADPLNETAHMVTMRLLAKLGRYGAALQQYDTLVNLLAEELDVSPLPETEALAQTIRQEREKLAASQSITAVPFIGRQRERAQLIAQLEKLTSGHGRLIFVEGEPGIGKTRLLEEITSAAIWRGIRTAWGRTAEFTTPLPYAPLPDALQAAINGPHFATVNAALTPMLRDLLSPFIPRFGSQEVRLPDLRPANNQPKLPTATAVRKLLLALAQTTPSLIIFDDVQWADDNFWEMITAVAEAAAQSPLLVILSFRSQALRQNNIVWQLLQALDRDYAPLRLQLTGLSDAESDTFAQALATLTPEKRRQIHRLSHGNPLIIQELALNEDEAASLTGLLAVRLADLSETAVSGLAAAAILGREFDGHIWQAMLAEPPPITELLTHRFLIATDQGYAFPHDLVRAHIIQNTLPETRQKWHGRAANALLHEAASAPTLAWHYEQAGQFSQAVYYYRHAAEHALKLENPEAARDFCNRALAIAAPDHLTPAEKTLEPPAEAAFGLSIAEYKLQIELPLRCLRLQIEQFSNWSSDNEAEADAIEKLARQHGDQETLLNILLVRLNFLTAQGRLDELQVVGEEALKIAQELINPRAEIHTLTEVALKLLFTLGQTQQAISLSQRAVTLAESLPDNPLPLSRALFVLTVSFLHARQLDAARPILARAETIISQHPDLASLEPELLYYQAIVAQLSVEWEKSRALQHRLVEIHRRANNYAGLVSALYNSAHVASFIGQHEEAILFAEELVQYVQANSAADDRYLIHFYRTMLLDCYTMAGAFAAAEQLLPEIMAWLNEEEAGRGSINGWTAVGTLRFYQGQLDAAQYAYSRAVALAVNSGATTASPFLCHAEASKLLGRDEEAQASFTEATNRIRLPTSGSNGVYYYYVAYLMTNDVAKLHAARMMMLDLVNRLEDSQLSRDYFYRMPLHRDIEKYWHAQPMQRIQVQLARRDVPLGRPLVPADRVEVEWTIDAGAVDAMVLKEKGKVGLRQARLLRLAAEARAHGAAPTHTDLAQALKVTTRTIERDSAKLEAVGTPLYTRRHPKIS